MQLYDTLTRGKQELPPPPAPVRMYFCGPTVYQRAHIGNARPYILGMWLRSWLRTRGYDVTLVHNITDINDKIYEAAPGASAELAARATEWYLEDTDALGLGRPDALPKATEVVPQMIRFISDLIERDHAYESEGDVYFRVSSYPEYGRLSGQRPDQVEEQEPNPRKEDPRDFALWKANKPGRGHVVGLALGPGPPRLAHRVLGDGGGTARARRSRSTAAGSTSSFRTTRTSSRNRGRSATTSHRSGRTTASCASPAPRCRSPRATSSRSATRSRSGDGRRSSSSS